jgi:hypothetical protein
MADVAFDYTNLVEVEGGVTDAELRELRPRLEEAAATLLDSSPGFMRIPKTAEYADRSKALAEEIRASGATDFVHVGSVIILEREVGTANRSGQL